MTQEELITIYSEATPNPESMKFVLNRMILPNDSADFRVIEKTTDAPLAAALFELPYVNGVFIMNNFVSVTRVPGVDWFEAGPVLKDFIKSYIESGKPILNPKKTISDDDLGTIENKIKKLLDEYVKPAVEMDGGAIDFKSFENGVVTVQMKGSCSGCPSSTMTLKSGIENLLKRMVPEVEAVEAEAV